MHESAVAAHAQHLIDRQRHPRVVRLMLSDQRDSPGDLDRPGGRFEKSGDEMKERGLPAAIGSDQSEHHTGTGLQIGGRQRDRGPVVDADASGRDTRIGRRDPCRIEGCGFHVPSVS